MAADAITGFGLGVGFVSAIIAMRILYHFSIKMVTVALDETGS